MWATSFYQQKNEQASSERKRMSAFKQIIET